MTEIDGMHSETQKHEREAARAVEETDDKPQELDHVRSAPEVQDPPHESRRRAWGKAVDAWFRKRAAKWVGKDGTNVLFWTAIISFLFVFLVWAACAFFRPLSMPERLSMLGAVAAIVACVGALLRYLAHGPEEFKEKLDVEELNEMDRTGKGLAVVATALVALGAFVGLLLG